MDSTMHFVAVALTAFGFIAAGAAVLAILGLVFEEQIRNALGKKKENKCEKES